MVIADYYYPDWACLVDFLLQSRVEKLLAWAAGDWTDNPLDLCSQSGDYDLSATATCIDFSNFPSLALLGCGG